MRRICAELKRRGVPLRPPPEVSGAAWISTAEPDAFLAAWRGALEAAGVVVLVPPGLPADAVDEARGLVADFLSSAWREECAAGASPLVLIPTGGSSGRLRFAVHRLEGLVAAAEGFAARFGAAAAATVNVLPLAHVGGLMTLMRALVAGAPWCAADYRALAEHPATEGHRGSLSLVPTQLRRLLEVPAAVRHLRAFDRIFVGGATLPPEDAARARAEGLRLAPCYGMTETAAMVTALDPEDFLAGAGGCGAALPHVSVELAEAGATADRPARILLRGASLALGHWPGGGLEPGSFAAGDEGFFDSRGSLHVVRRIDRLINTGGEKVDPARIERILADSLPGAEVRVEGVPDPDWGERVVAFVTAEPPAGGWPLAAWRAALGPAELPKEIHSVGSLPRTAMGKIDSLALRREWARSTLPPLPRRS